LKSSEDFSFDHNILIFNPNASEIEHLVRSCTHLGNINTAESLSQAIVLLAEREYGTAIIDHSMADYSLLKGLFRPATSIVITGTDEALIKKIIKGWPADRYMDFHSVPFDSENGQIFLRTVKKALDHAHLMAKVEKLQNSAERRRIEIQEAFDEIKEIKKLINKSVIRELEKRLNIESQYLGFQKEKSRIEDILKRVYTADDVTSLIDIVFDIREILIAGGISFYVLEESQKLGHFLKPLVWDDAILPHPDVAAHIIKLDSEDFAASTALYGREINVLVLSNDRRLSSRYKNHLKSPLKDILSVPIMHDKQIIGVIEVYNKTTKPTDKTGFTFEDQQILGTLCEHISIAINKLNLIQYDALTGLLRPLPFLEKVVQRMKSKSNRREESDLSAFVMGDVDWFKHYNDRNGHESGNRLLRDLAAILKASIREEDLLCRYGGEEFLFFLSNIKSQKESIGFTERIRRSVEEHYFPHQEFQPRHNLTMSFGISNFSKERFRSLQSEHREALKILINEADMALLDAKGRKKSVGTVTGDDTISEPSKNRVCFYETGSAVTHGLSVEKGEEASPTLEKDQRKYRRIFASILMLCRKKRDEIQEVTKTVNLSLGGAKIRTSSRLPIDHPLDLILILDNRACPCEGQVVYCVPKPETDVYESGIRFEGLSSSCRGILDRYLTGLFDGQPSSRPA